MNLLVTIHGYQTVFQAVELCEIVLILIPFFGTFAPKSTHILNFFLGRTDFAPVLFIP